MFGSNNDWYVKNDYLVMVNKRGVSKTAFIDSKKDFSQPARWISKYGSVTFNGRGREFPKEGMNETGLVVCMLMLEETEYPASDSRPSITKSQWIQYQLDNFSEVEQVIASNSQLRITNPPSDTKSHYLVCDRTGNCAVIEFINGNLVYYTNEKMPVKTLTNTTYTSSIEFWKQGKLPVPDRGRSVERFITAANMVKKHNPKTTKSAVDYAFNVLANVAQGEVEEVEGQQVESWITTQQSIVYDMKNLRVYFHTFENKKIRYFNLNSFDFSCKTPVKVFDVHANLSGDVTNKFIDYTQQINRDLIGNVFRQTFHLRGVPEEELDRIAQYPESTICTEK